MRKILTAGIAALAVAGIAGGAFAQLKSEEVLKMRQGMMVAVKANFGPIGGFAQGKNDLPADAAARAANLAALAKMAPMGWGKGSENLEGGKTKAEAFGSADFANGWTMMGDAAVKLEAAAKSGNADAIKAAAAEVGKTCKGCHDNFKKD